ncbi:uncharacterized protein J4E78_006237 [Alternaria triticimaculans]|uniref:uncharacterized protein n=1 Tax=Alternaria triticimaculans TaxID=297637 RepID=UPI0020C3C688|nr:uncharacterized protein J4E78_006237 [Alternaria triticimaculans]KAI4657848.1 hypothetical protein J4E78_006237 [Alternaria triticimaculans]
MTLLSCYDPNLLQVHYGLTQLRDQSMIGGTILEGVRYLQCNVALVGYIVTTILEDRHGIDHHDTTIEDVGFFQCVVGNIVTTYYYGISTSFILILRNTYPQQLEMQKVREQQMAQQRAAQQALSLR